MNMDRSLSIGNAFDGWQYCDNTSWEQYKTNNGRQMVRYSCSKNSYIDFIDSMDISEEYKSFLQLKDITFEAKWAIGIDDKSFNFDSAEIVYSWKNGESHRASLKVEDLSVIYQNKRLAIHDGSAKTFFSTLALNYYEKYKEIIEIEKLAKRADVVFEKNKDTIKLSSLTEDLDLFKTINNASDVKALYDGLKNYKGKNNPFDIFLTDVLVDKDENTLVNISIAIKILQFLSEDTEVKIQTPIISYVYFMNASESMKKLVKHFGDKDMFFATVLHYIAQKPKLRQYLQVPQNDEKRDIFNLWSLDNADVEDAKLQLEVVNLLLDNDIKPSMYELCKYELLEGERFEQLKTKYPGLANRLRKIHRNYLEDKTTTYEINRRYALEGKVLDIKYNALASDYMMIYSKEQTVKVYAWVEKTVSKYDSEKDIPKNEIKELSMIIRSNNIDVKLQVISEKQKNGTIWNDKTDNIDVIAITPFKEARSDDESAYLVFACVNNSLKAFINWKEHVDFDQNPTVATYIDGKIIKSRDWENKSEVTFYLGDTHTFIKNLSNASVVSFENINESNVSFELNGLSSLVDPLLKTCGVTSKSVCVEKGGSWHWNGSINMWECL